MNRLKKEKLKRSLAGAVALLLAFIMVLGAIAPLFGYMFY